MKGKRFRSINFILWISFLAFAAFILLMTWVFQTTLLRRFFTDEVKSDLEEIGGDVYRNISALQFAGENAGESIDAYIALAQYDNPSINIYVLDKNSVCLYPTNLEDGEEFGIEGVDKEVFSFILDQLELAGSDRGVIVQIDDGNYVYSARLRSVGQNEGNYVYVNYSTELSNSAFSLMQRELVVVAIVVVFVALIISLFINRYWKISAHMVAAGSMVTLVFLMSFYGLMLTPYILPLQIASVLLAGAIGSSRILLKRHTLGQVGAGFALGILCCGSMFFIFV